MKKTSQGKKQINDRLIKDIIITDKRTLFQLQEEKYKPKRVSDFLNNYIECESNGDRNRNLLLEKYFNKIEPYLMGIIIDLQYSDILKIQLTIAINFIFSRDAEEECLMHSDNENLKFASFIMNQIKFLMNSLSHFV